MSNTSNNILSSNVSKKVKGTSTFVKILIIIFAVIIVIGLIVWLVFLIKNKISYVNNNPIIISGEMPADTTNTSDNAYKNANLPTSINGNLYSYSVWIYINDFTTGYGKYKNILSKSSYSGNKSSDNQGVTDISGSESPGLYLDKTMNKLIVYTSLMGNNNDGKDKNVCEINNIPLNKWCHIVYVLNQNSVDLYLNGKLERSCVINGLAYSKDTENLYICKSGGYNGKVAQLQYFTEALTPDTVIQLYNKGPTGSNKLLTDDNQFSNVNYSQLKNDICTGNTSDIGDILKNTFNDL